MMRTKYEIYNKEIEYVIFEKEEKYKLFRCLMYSSTLKKIIWIRLEFKQIVRDREQWREKNNRKGDIMREKNESNETLQPGNFEI